MKIAITAVIIFTIETSTTSIIIVIIIVMKIVFMIMLRIQVAHFCLFYLQQDLRK